MADFCKAKWKNIQAIITESKSILEEGMQQLADLYTTSGLKADLAVRDMATWKSKQYLDDIIVRFEEQSELKKVDR